MSEWSISRRIASLAGALIGGLLIVATVGTVSNWLFGQKFDRYRSVTDGAFFVSALRERALEAEGLVLRYRFDRSPATAEAADGVLEEIDAKLPRLRALIAEDPSGNADLVGVEERLSAYHDGFHRTVTLNGDRDTLVEASRATDGALKDQVTAMLEEARVAQTLAILPALAVIQRSVLDSSLAKERFLASNDEADYDAAVRTAEEARSALRRLATDPLAPSGTASVLAALDVHGTALADTAAALLARNDLTAELDALSKDFLARLDDAVAADLADTAVISDAIERAVTLSLIVVTAISAVAVAGSAIFATRSARAIRAALVRTVDETQDLASGNLDATITGADQDHELGQLAKALVVFRDNAKAARALEAQQAEQERAARRREEEQARDRAAAEEESRRQAAEARARMVAELRDSLGAVVDGAASGDFSRRITTRFAEEEFNRMANGVNLLMSNVEAGVKEVARVMSKVAAGDLTERMTGTYAGLFAELQASVNETLGTLTRVVDDIAAGCEAVTRQAGQMTEQSVELARRAEQQAASLEETSAAMEEISATARSSAEGAAHANEFATRATGRVDEAGRVVASAVGAMSDIRAASTRIGEIVSVIEGIAFQTNLLALNASVEAARAGSAGKGFAVVATEVRALAQRSSAASQDIKTLIDESAAQVNRGVTLVEETGTTLKEIVEGVRQMAGSLGDLVTAGQEQAVGVQEVTTAISQLDVITQKNAALADRSRDLAGDLKSRAEAMEGLVATFRTGSGRSATPGGPAPRLEDDWQAA